jgi:hypothetical protein
MAAAGPEKGQLSRAIAINGRHLSCGATKKAGKTPPFVAPSLGQSHLFVIFSLNDSDLSPLPAFLAHDLKVTLSHRAMQLASRRDSL